MCNAPRSTLLLLLGFICATGARAQSSFNGLSVGPIVFQGGPAIGGSVANPSTDVVELSRPLTGASAFCVPAPPGGSGGCAGSGYTLPLGAFASQQGLQQLNNQIAHNRSIAAQGIALSSAITIMPPNPGDRFSLTFGGAGFDGEGAGSVSVTYKPANQFLVFGGYARSSGENLVKGGVSFSFP